MRCCCGGMVGMRALDLFGGSGRVGRGVLGVAVLAAALFLGFFVRVYRIDGTSMNYGLIDGDLVLAWRRPGTIHRGDLLVVRHPDDPQQRFYIKRCVALPGDRYFVKERLLYLQLEHNATLTARLAATYGLETAPTQEGVYLKEPYRPYYGIVHNPNLVLPKTMTDHTPETIPDAHYYTMGDYRDNSADSRIYGPVPRSWIIARIVMILKWPHNWNDLIAIQEADP